MKQYRITAQYPEEVDHEVLACGDVCAEELAKELESPQEPELLDEDSADEDQPCDRCGGFTPRVHHPEFGCCSYPVGAFCGWHRAIERRMGK